MEYGSQEAVLCALEDASIHENDYGNETIKKLRTRIQKPIEHLSKFRLFELFGLARPAQFDNTVFLLDISLSGNLDNLDANLKEMSENIFTLAQYKIFLKIFVPESLAIQRPLGISYFRLSKWDDDKLLEIIEARDSERSIFQTKPPDEIMKKILLVANGSPRRLGQIANRLSKYAGDPKKMNDALNLYLEENQP